MIDKDTEAFNSYMAAMKLPKATEADQAAREEAMQKVGGPRQYCSIHLIVLDSRGPNFSDYPATICYFVYIITAAEFGQTGFPTTV